MKPSSMSCNDLARARAFAQTEQIVRNIIVCIGLKILPTVMFGHDQIGFAPIDVGVKGISAIEYPADGRIF